jgi:hypothetical protein
MLECCNSRNINVVKYLAKNCKMSVNLTGYRNKSCILFACENNTNIDITKYLIEDCQSSIMKYYLKNLILKI